MWWLAVAQAVGKYREGNLAAANAFKQTAQEKMQEEDALLQNTAENKAIAEANLQNLIRTGYRAGLINVQRAQAKRQAQSAGFNLADATQEVLGANSANAAAVGAVGPSVNAVAADVAVQTDKAEAQQDENLRVVNENFDVQMQDLVQVGMDAQRSVRKLNVRNIHQDVVNSDTIAASGLAAGLASYFNSRMNATS